MEHAETQTNPERDDQVWLDEHLAFEQLPTNMIEFQISPIKWHPVLIKFLEQLTAAAELWEKRKRDHKAAQMRNSKKNGTGVNFDEVNFSRTGRDVGMLVVHHHASAFRVTTLTYKRALAIANTILFAAESRGCSVGYNEFRSRLTIKLEDAELFLSVRERQDYQVSNDRDGDRKVYQMTDRIAISVDQRYGAVFEVVDKPTLPVEKRLNDIFVRLYKSVLVARAESRLQIVKDERRKIENEAYEKITQQRAIEANMKAEEKVSRDSLIHEADRWQQTQKIRAYAAQVIAMAGPRPNQKTLDWVDWATSVADEMDPSIARHEMLLKTM